MNGATIDPGFFIALVIIAFATMLREFKVNLKICEPNEILIFSGRRRKLKTGEMVGYRVIRGDWGLRTPIIERVSRLSPATIPIEMEIQGALSNGMIPLNINSIAPVKIDSTDGGGRLARTGRPDLAAGDAKIQAGPAKLDCVKRHDALQDGSNITTVLNCSRVAPRSPNTD